MKPKIQVKGTLPLVAEFLGVEEQKIYSIFNLNLKEETKVGSDKKKGETEDGTADKGKTLQPSENCI
ncbi:MAG: hypothetical protein IJA34_08010 [Lachnospiraceae bacterium]|nr:hypothetical protein [Lachnospiraceae bacterium]